MYFTPVLQTLEAMFSLSFVSTVFLLAWIFSIIFSLIRR